MLRSGPFGANFASKEVEGCLRRIVSGMQMVSSLLVPTYHRGPLLEYCGVETTFGLAPRSARCLTAAQERLIYYEAG